MSKGLHIDERDNRLNFQAFLEADMILPPSGDGGVHGAPDGFFSPNCSSSST